MTVEQAILSVNPSYYGKKDGRKFRACTKFIANGVQGTSSAKYAKALADITNTGVYTNRDIVGISVNGGFKQHRAKFDETEVMKAINAGVAYIITDNEANRTRPYNTGERELATFLNKYCTVEDYKLGALWTVI